MRTGHGAKSGAIRDRAIVALLSERGIDEAAERCQVSERTLRRWLAEDSDFQEQYKNARTAVYEVAINRVQGMVGRAVTALEDLLDAKDFPGIRLGAAKTIIELAIHRDQAERLERRIGELEQIQQQLRKDS